MIAAKLLDLDKQTCGFDCDCVLYCSDYLYFLNVTVAGIYNTSYPGTSQAFKVGADIMRPPCAPPLLAWLGWESIVITRPHPCGAVQLVSLLF